MVVSIGSAEKHNVQKCTELSVSDGSWTVDGSVFHRVRSETEKLLWPYRDILERGKPTMNHHVLQSEMTSIDRWRHRCAHLTTVCWCCLMLALVTPVHASSAVFSTEDETNAVIPEWQMWYGQLPITHMIRALSTICRDFTWAALTW